MVIFFNLLNVDRPTGSKTPMSATKKYVYVVEKHSLNSDLLNECWIWMKQNSYARIMDSGKPLSAYPWDTGVSLCSIYVNPISY